ncbi:MAG TPA: GNAT family N-acetyltransferase [Edaphocola sp.]|nr:GNAT family N-acetyltransferase [Edaphocola sp.]
MIEINKATKEEILDYLLYMDGYFTPALSTITDIYVYANKIYEKAKRIEFYNNNKFIALLAFYLNPIYSFAFITTISVNPLYARMGIAQELLERLILICIDRDICFIDLEVNINNSKALNFYEKMGFCNREKKTETLILRRVIDTL